MATVVRTISRADRALADAFAQFGVATTHEAQGRRGLVDASLSRLGLRPRLHDGSLVLRHRCHRHVISGFAGVIV